MGMAYCIGKRSILLRPRHHSVFFATETNSQKSIQASSDAVESDGRQIKQCGIKYTHKKLQRKRDDPFEKLAIFCHFVSSDIIFLRLAIFYVYDFCFPRNIVYSKATGAVRRKYKI
jgi:hypothetical protein